MMKHRTAKRLPPLSAQERREFDRGFTAYLRSDATRANFKYHDRNKDTVNPRPVAHMIKRAVAAGTPSTLLSDLERSVHMMVLCAGGLLSLDVPLDVQYLAAHQRINDWHAELILETPEELARVGALIHAARAVGTAAEACAAWEKGAR